MLLTIFALPIAYLVWLATLAVSGRRAWAGLSLLVAGTTFAVGAWEILQSRASTAAIGFVFLPALAAVAGSLVLGYSASRGAHNRALRMLGLAALIAAGLPAVAALRGGRRTIVKNANRDADQARRDSAYARYRVRLDTILARSGDRATDTLEALLRARGADRELVLAGLERPQVGASLLDTFARSPDLGIALQAIRNPATAPETLERIYRTHQYRDYFLQALAAHANTPPAILREIRALNPAPITGLDIWFAGNRSTPADVLLDVARTSESIDAVRALLRHPALDCAMIGGIARGPAVRSHPGDADVASHLASERPARCH
ncbi:MAG: hypothetical protein ACJ79A_07895 [Gemmatimonadaceae bacterium]